MCAPVEEEDDEDDNGLAKPPPALPCPDYEFTEMPGGSSKALLTELRYQGAEVDQVRVGVWRKGRLVDICGPAEAGGASGILYATPDDPNVVILLANVTKRVTRRSLEQRAVVHLGDGQEITPSVRVVGEEHLRKIPGCVSTRKRVWADLMGNAPECKKLLSLSEPET